MGKICEDKADDGHQVEVDPRPCGVNFFQAVVPEHGPQPCGHDAQIEKTDYRIRSGDRNAGNQQLNDRKGQDAQKSGAEADLRHHEGIHTFSGFFGINGIIGPSQDGDGYKHDAQNGRARMLGQISDGGNENAGDGKHDAQDLSPRNAFVQNVIPENDHEKWKQAVNDSGNICGACDQAKSQKGKISAVAEEPVNKSGL